MERKPIIVGIDPGTTLGYAIIDLEGNPLHVHSSKFLGLSEIIKRVTEVGRVLAVGCDKKNAPAFVEKFSIKVGARLIVPDHDLLIREKKELLGNVRTENSHKLDSLASAFFAFKELRSVLRKVRLYIERNEKHGIAADLYDLVVKKGISIHHAASLIEAPEREEIRVIEKAEDESSKKALLRMFDKIIGLEKKVAILNEEKKAAQRRLKDAESDNIDLERTIKRKDSKENSKKRILHKEKTIQKLGKGEADLRKKNELLNKEMMRVTRAVLDVRDYYVLKRLPNFGASFEARKDILNIKEGDVVVVDEPSIISRNTMGYLKARMPTIVGRKKFSRKFTSNYPFIVIDGSKLRIKDFRYFSLVKKKDLDRLKSGTRILKKIVEEYRMDKIT